LNILTASDLFAIFCGPQAVCGACKYSQINILARTREKIVAASKTFQPAKRRAFNNLLPNYLFSIICRLIGDLG
jgi:hypothetical protein